MTQDGPRVPTDQDINGLFRHMRLHPGNPQFFTVAYNAHAANPEQWSEAVKAIGDPEDTSPPSSTPLPVAFLPEAGAACGQIPNHPDQIAAMFALARISPSYAQDLRDAGFVWFVTTAHGGKFLSLTGQTIEPAKVAEIVAATRTVLGGHQ